ncbi:MAG: DUF222 domain-containing protein, partial [Actinomycetales bacterium]
MFNSGSEGSHGDGDDPSRHAHGAGAEPEPGVAARGVGQPGAKHADTEASLADPDAVADDLGDNGRPDDARGPDAQLLSAVQVAQRAVGVAQAMQAMAVARFADLRFAQACELAESMAGATTGEMRGIDWDGSGEVAFVTHTAKGATETFVHQCSRLVHALPGMLRLLAAGRVVWQHVAAVVRETSEVDEVEVLALIEADALASFDSDPNMWLTPQGLAARFRAAMMRLDPDAVRARRERAADDRSVWTEPLPDGLARLVAEGPAEAIQAMYQAVCALADTLGWRAGDGTESTSAGSATGDDEGAHDRAPAGRESTSAPSSVPDAGSCRRPGNDETGEAHSPGERSHADVSCAQAPDSPEPASATTGSGTSGERPADPEPDHDGAITNHDEVGRRTPAPASGNTDQTPAECSGAAVVSPPAGSASTSLDGSVETSVRVPDPVLAPGSGRFGAAISSLPAGSASTSLDGSVETSVRVPDPGLAPGSGRFGAAIASPLAGSVPTSLDGSAETFAREPDPVLAPGCGRFGAAVASPLAGSAPISPDGSAETSVRVADPGLAPGSGRFGAAIASPLAGSVPTSLHGSAETSVRVPDPALAPANSARLPATGAAADAGSAGGAGAGNAWERWTRPEWFGAVTDPACRWSPGRDRFDALRLIAETVLADPAGVLMRHHTTPTTL